MMASDQQVALARAHRGGSSHLNRAARQVVPAFLQKLYEIVNDPASDDLIRWSDTGDSFFVLDHERFARELLGRWFKHSNPNSFIRQLNMYGFRKILHLQQGVLRSEKDTEFWHYGHHNFHRGQPDLLLLIQRKKQAAQPGDDVPMDLRDPSAAARHISSPAVGNLSADQIIDINSIVNGISAIKRHQTAISTDLNELKNANQLLWQEASSARERHKKQQDIINRILKFLAGVFGHTTAGSHKEDERNNPRVVVPRQPQRLMIGDGRDGRGKGVRIDEVQDEGVKNSFRRELSPFMSGTSATIGTPASSVMSPSVAPSEAFSPTAADPSSGLPSIPSHSRNTQPPTEHLQQTRDSPLPTSQEPPAQVNPPPSVNAHPQLVPQSPNTVSTSLATTGSPQSQDALLQSAFAQMLQSPGQMQRLLSALSSHSPYPLPDAPQSVHPSDPQPPSQLTQFDPRFYSPDGFSPYAPRSPLPLIASPSPKTDELAALDADASRLQKTYQDAAEIDADVSALHTSINSLISSLGLDPSLIAASSSVPTSAPDPAAPIPTHAAPPPLGETHSEMPAPDFDFDAFLTEFSRDGDMNTDYAELADRLDPGGGRTSPANDPSPEQLTAFLDEASSQSDGTASPVVSMRHVGNSQPRGQKRNSDVAELMEEQPSAKRKR